MNKTKIESLLRQIEDADNVGFQFHDGIGLAYCATGVSKLTGEPDNEVLSLEWLDKDHQMFIAKFTERGLDDARISGGIITLEDHEGDTAQISLFVIEPLPIVTVW